MSPQHVAGLAIAIAICAYAALGLLVLAVLAWAPAKGDKQSDFAQLDHELTLAEAENIHDHIDPASVDDDLDSMIRAGVDSMNEENARRAAAERDMWERGLQ